MQYFLQLLTNFTNFQRYSIKEMDILLCAVLLKKQTVFNVALR